MPSAPAERAPAKVNLTLRVAGKRPDGYHEIESLVVFAAVDDRLTFTAGRELALVVRGPTAGAAGELSDNLVLKAVRALAERAPDIKLGRFALTKRLPVSAGVGGGSSDAAAALRLLARANRMELDDPRVMAAARATGADVPVCLDPRPRVMRGIGEILSAPLKLPRLHAVLVNPGVAVPTRDVFARLAAPKLAKTAARKRQIAVPGGRPALMSYLCSHPNDLEAPAVSIAPAIADVLAALGALAGCRLARMSGSGATCFGLFDTSRAAEAAARALRAKNKGWWVRSTLLG